MLNRIVKRTAQAVLLVGVLGSAAQAQDMPAMPPAKVDVALVKEEMVSPMTEATGSVISKNDSRLATEVDGKLVWIADVGTHVAAGEEVARLDDRVHRVTVKQMEAAVARLEADLVYRAGEVERFKQLAARDHTSRSRLQEVTATHDMLVQDLANARVSLEKARGDLARTVIRAPFGGSLVEKLANVGEYINTGGQVARFVDTGNIEISLPAPIAIAPILKPGLEVTVNVDGRSIPATVRAVVPVGDRVSRQVEVRLAADPADWIIGQGVTVSLPLKMPENMMTVPRDALQRSAASLYFVRVNAENKAEIVPADIGAAVGDIIAVRSGLNAGDRVVVRGGERLQPGAPLITSD